MKRLIDLGLFGMGLVPVNTQELAERYNACLEELGIEPTKLTQFSIDGAGWSPEIAREKKNRLYLCAGIANPMAVILTPDQYGKPVYFPYHSFTRRMLKAFFDRFDGAIADITATMAIGLDIDQELTRYENPSDLALVRSIIVRSVAGELFSTAKAQQNLVQRFNKDDLSWFDPAFRQEIIGSGIKYGDLRYRNLDVPDFKFDIRSFYAQVFDGVFILRPLKNEKTLLVTENEKYADSAMLKMCHAVAIGDPKLPEQLRQEGLVEINFKWLKEHPDHISDQKEGMLMDVLFSQKPDTRYAPMNSAQKRQIASKFSDELPRVYHQLERVERRMENGEAPELGEIPDEIKVLLMRPHHRLALSEQEVLQMLLCRLQRFGVVKLYHSDKNLFFGQYKTWPDRKREWAANLIRERWSPRKKEEEKR